MAEHCLVTTVHSIQKGPPMKEQRGEMKKESMPEFPYSSLVHRRKVQTQPIPVKPGAMQK